jgi:hypothetical protein
MENETAASPADVILPVLLPSSSCSENLSATEPFQHGYRDDERGRSATVKKCFY